MNTPPGVPAMAILSIWGRGKRREEEAERAGAEKAMAAAEKTIEETERLGLSTNTIEGLMGEAEKALIAHDYQTAKAKVIRAQALLRKIKEDALAQILEQLRGRISSLEDMGLDVARYKAGLRRARAFIDRGDHEEGLEECMQITMELQMASRGAKRPA